MTQSELILQVLGVTSNEVIEALNAAKEQGRVVALRFPLPRISVADLPVVFSNDCKEVEALIVPTIQEARSDELQTETLSPPNSSTRNEQESSEPSPTMGDGNGKDGRNDKHTPQPVQEGLDAKEDTDSKSTCNFV